MNSWGFGELLIQTVRNSQRRWNFIRCIIRRVGEILTFGFRLSHVNAWVGPVPVQAVPGDPSMSELGHGEKNSQRAYLVSIASISGIPRCIRTGPGRANSGRSEAHPNPS